MQKDDFLLLEKLKNTESAQPSCVGEGGSMQDLESRFFLTLCVKSHMARPRIEPPRVTSVSPGRTLRVCVCVCAAASVYTYTCTQQHTYKQPEHSCRGHRMSGCRSGSTKAKADQRLCTRVLPPSYSHTPTVTHPHPHLTHTHPPQYIYVCICIYIYIYTPYTSKLV